MTLLNNKFAPITFKMAFLRARLNEVVKTYVRWQHMTLRTVSEKDINGSLVNKLESILPLDDGGERVLFSETASEWVAIFDNGLRGRSPVSIMSVLGEWMGVQGVALTDIPHTFKKSAPREERGVWGALSISEHGRREDGDWGMIRLVSLRNDVGGWKFEHVGRPWEFEEVDRYDLKPVKGRLNSTLLTSYLSHFDIRRDEAFFDGSAVTTNSHWPFVSVRKMYDLMDIQRQMRL